MNKYNFQNRLFNFYCLYYLFSMMYNDKRSAESLRKLQNRRLQMLIQRAYQVPFYKKRFDDAGINPDSIKTKADLYKIPVLTKAEYREWMNRELKNPETRFFNKTQTSGSTGIPTTNIYPPKEYAQHYMMDLWGWMKGGYNPFWGKTLTRQPGDESVGVKSFIQKLGILRRDIFNTYWERDKITEKIINYKPDFLLANSSELIYIAQYIHEQGIDIPKPKFYCPNGENIDGLAEKILKETYGSGLINLYGCTEMASFGVKKPQSDEYEIMEDLVVVNIKRDYENHDDNRGSLLATPLYRMQYPMINYEIGDIVTLREEKGRQYILHIEGRKNDFFIWKNGKKTIYKRLEDINMTLQDIYQIRFIQETDTKLLIQVVKDLKSNKTEEELESYLNNKYKNEFAGLIIDYEWLSVIPPDPNGKIRNMISKINSGDKL